MSCENCYKEKMSMQNYIAEHFENIRAPFTGGIELTGSCNLRCVHCYAETYRNQHTRTMKTEQIKHIIDQWVDMGLLELFITGGEALTRHDFAEIYTYIRKKGVFVALLTNATLINTKILDLLEEYPVEMVSITMYGMTKETYENVTGVDGSYDQFMNAIQLLRERKIPFELKTIGLTINYHETLDMRKFAEELGVNCRTGFDIRPMNDGNKAPLKYRVSPKQAFQIDILDKKRRSFWENVGKNPLPQKNSDQRRIDSFLYPCHIAQQFAFVTADGYLRGCVKSVEYQYDLLQGTFMEGWRLLKLNLIDKKASSHFPCLKCDMFRYCEQCTSNFILENKDAERPVRFYCQVASLRKQFAEQYSDRAAEQLTSTTDSFQSHLRLHDKGL